MAEQSSEEPLSDDAILALFEFANWDVEYDDLEQAWMVRPRNENFIGYASFTNLQQAMEYMLHYKNLYEF